MAEVSLRLYDIKGNEVFGKKDIPKVKERIIQNLIESNMEKMFSTRLVAREYTITGGRMDSIGLDENFSPVIFEYKQAEIEKIKNVFLAILRDIKKDIDNGEQPGEAVTAAMFQAMRDALAEQKQKPLSIDDVTAMIAGQIGQLAPMDEETADLFQRLVKKMIEQAEK